MYKTLVLSGGALRGFALLGAIQVLQDKNLLKNIDTYVGTSIGAIIGYLLCIGYNPIEILLYINKEEFIENLSSNLDIINGFQGKGLLSFDIIKSILEKMTIEKCNKLMTLKELYETSNKLLVCCTYNYTDGILEFISKDTFPELKCIDALQMSSSLPILFEPYIYNEKIYIDGAIISNFPFFYNEIGNKDTTIGIKFIKRKKNQNESNIIYLYNILMIPIEHLDLLLNDKYKGKIIEIDISECDYSLDFKLTHKNRLDMFSCGYENTLKKLK